MTKLRALAIVLLCAVSPVGHAAAIDQFLNLPFREYGSSVRSITNKLGPPIASKVALVPNPHDGDMPNVRVRLEYDHAVFSVLIVTCCDNSLLESVRIGMPPRIGDRSLLPASRADVERELGPPTSATGGALLYKIENEVGVDTVTFFCEGSAVRRVEWSYFID